jgi:citrate lyase alpha subunit
MKRQQRLMTLNNLADLRCYQDASKANLQARKPRDIKRCDTLEQAVRRSGLQDGMTISFHHAFRGGDLALNQVMETLAAMGFRNLTLASSSLSECHAPLVGHIRNGVVSRIYTSGLRGPLADAISRGLLAEPVQIHSHGGRVNLIESGELAIDVAFLGVPACDEFWQCQRLQRRSLLRFVGLRQSGCRYRRHRGVADRSDPALSTSSGQPGAGSGRSDCSTRASGGRRQDRCRRHPHDF